METADTKYIFLNDVDFEPMPKLDDHLKRYISKGYLPGKTVGESTRDSGELYSKKDPAHSG